MSLTSLNFFFEFYLEPRQKIISGGVAQSGVNRERESLVGIVPALIFFVAGEAMQYIGPVFAGIVDYSRLFRHFLNMTGDAMFHVFTGRSRIYLLKMQKK